MTEETTKTIETTDSWPLGKILKCILLSKPKGSPKAGKKEISLRLCVGGCFGILSFLLWSATHTIRLPSCDKTETLSTIEKIVNGLPDAVAKNIKYVSLGNIAEQGYNEQQELRTCTGKLVTTDGEINVHYTLRWQDKQAGQFYAEINVSQQPAAESNYTLTDNQQPQAEAYVPPETALNIALDKWVHLMNEKLKESKMEALTLNTGNTACDEQNACTSAYQAGKYVGYLVTHRNGQIHSVMSMASGDGSLKSGADIMLGSVIMAVVLSPNADKEKRASIMLNILQKAFDGEKIKPHIIDGIRYEGLYTKGVGVFIEAKKDVAL